MENRDCERCGELESAVSALQEEHRQAIQRLQERHSRELEQLAKTNIPESEHIEQLLHREREVEQLREQLHQAEQNIRTETRVVRVPTEGIWRECYEESIRNVLEHRGDSAIPIVEQIRSGAAQLHHGRSIHLKTKPTEGV